MLQVFLSQEGSEWEDLRLQWHELVRKLVNYLGFNFDVLKLHVQDAKLLISLQEKGEQAPHFGMCKNQNITENTTTNS